ncbi:MAG TPA: hypothetical protein VGJ91_16000 [Polyangiaceae bacterium]
MVSMFGATFSEACQPLAQPGTQDAACPQSPMAPIQGTGLQISFPGCCRANHTCGYQLDTIAGAVALGLGCVDATPFLAGEAPQSCAEAGAGGAGGDSSVAGAGGDSRIAGAGGDSSGAGAGTGGELSAAGVGG